MISIIIPLYNKEKTIGKTIESVLSQTAGPWELIVVNDGSTDNSLNVVQKYLKDDRIQLVDKPNGGVSSARNAGIRCAHGEWILFLDADDYLTQNAFKIYNDAIRFSNAQVIISNFYMSSEANCQLYSKTKKSGYLNNYLIDWIRGDICPRCGSTLFNKILLRQNLYDERLSRSEDTKFAIEVLHGLKIYYTSEPVLFYDQDNLNLSKMGNFEKDYASVISLNKIPFWERVFLSDLVRRGMKNYPNSTKAILKNNNFYIFYYVLNRLIFFTSRVPIKLMNIFGLD